MSIQEQRTQYVLVLFIVRRGAALGTGIPLPVGVHGKRKGEGKNLRLAIKLPVQIHKFCDLTDIGAGLVKPNDLEEQIRVITG